MLIAREKRKSNVAEYVLYMWQLEDMLRAMQMDIRLVEQNIVSQDVYKRQGRACLLLYPNP